MTIISARIEKLERTSNLSKGVKRVYCVSGGSENDSATDFVLAHGYVLDEVEDLVIHIVGFAPIGGEPQPWQPEMGWCGPTPPVKWRAAA